MKDDKKETRPEAYPRPTEKDSQLHNNAEYIDQQPNDFHDKSISDLPANEAREKESNEPGR
jgi:hypothetical protein